MLVCSFEYESEVRIEHFPKDFDITSKETFENEQLYVYESDKSLKSAENLIYTYFGTLNSEPKSGSNIYPVLKDFAINGKKIT